MDKKKTSQEQKKSLQTLSLKGVKPYDPMERLLDRGFTLEAIVECLMNGDVKGAKEVFENYLWAINKSKLARDSKVPRSTIVHCLEHKNPEMDTFFKIMSA